MEDLQVRLLRLAALIPALVIHEFAHGYSAYRMGDPTAKMDGRLTLNPLAHLDPLGTLMILVVRFGWAKPVRVNPHNFRDPGRGLMISTACGPLANISMGVVLGLSLRLILAVVGLEGARNNVLVAFLAMLVSLNFLLAFFNLIPLGPLDGHEVLPYLLPYDLKARYHAFNRQYGMFVLLGLLFLAPMAGIHIVYYAVILPAELIGGLLVGQPPYVLALYALGLI